MSAIMNMAALEQIGACAPPRCPTGASSNVILAATNSVHDATIFLSTLVVLVSVCVGFVGAGVLQVLVLDGASVTSISSRLTRIIVLGVLGAVDLCGVFFALGALYSNTINGSISTGTLRAVFISSIIVIAANLALPVWAFSIARAVRWLREGSCSARESAE